ncbi:hypothetical protein CXB51_021497 [Gossypium anomalum]|uniref:Nitrate reductase n=1 Tax=Gossypium anomalum TaxID=47600 RepID=A0A8J6CX13_9ROSI|nr:hypothetical protein CXB51_021497 [Gossypium anomalum]
MAASVRNRQFTGLEPALNGVYNPLKPRPIHTHRHMHRVFVDHDYESSSEDEYNEIENYKAMIIKSNSEVEPLILDPRDEATADNWIDRNPSLVRLTGKHPFNSEPPLNRLMQYGFITPVPLHYVRNHGAVPKASWDDWTIEITGLVKRPIKLTMDQLVNEFQSREFPVTLVCAANRRKEQNMIKPTVGFNWGAAGISTSLWRGVPLCDVLKRCGTYGKKHGALNVCFEGAEDLPGGGGCKYGTSIKKEIAMDPSRDIILAYMQNGELLTPDHGFPVRIIIPGFNGGRMVKWLKRIIVTTKESDSFYYYRDNKVFPSHVDLQLANAEDWWYNPECAMDELNINSVITRPCHKEILPINSWTTRRPYTLRGYAYPGGGKKVKRVEVTMDGGETWQVCTVDHAEKPNKYGKFWCWCFWSLDVEVLDLLGAKEIAVRAWDETFNTQPQKLIWNLLISMSEVKKHNSVDSAWIVVRGHIYDCTHFLKDHPGGMSSILINAGTDCTDEFDAIHSDKAQNMLEDYRIGELITTGYVSDSAASSPHTSVHGASNISFLGPIKEVAATRPVALFPPEKIPCKLVDKTSISDDVRRFRFALPSEDQVLGVPVGKHIFLCATIDDKLCMRAYTPTSSIDEVGHFDLLVKIYFKGVHPKFPNGGLMSQYLDSLPLGSSLKVKGPMGHIQYTGRGNFLVHGKLKFAKKLAMLAGGTGITPIYQVIQAILKDPKDETEMYMDNILLKDELDDWAKKHDQLKVWYVKYLVQESIREGGQYSTGFIADSVLRDHIPEASSDTLALACGPPRMIQFAVQQNLEKMNYDIKDSLLIF